MVMIYCFYGHGWACPAYKCAVKLKHEEDEVKYMTKLHKTLHYSLTWEWPLKCHCGKEPIIVKKRGRKTRDGRKINTRFYFSCHDNKCLYYQALNVGLAKENEK